VPSPGFHPSTEKQNNNKKKLKTGLKLKMGRLMEFMQRNKSTGEPKRGWEEKQAF
jgi:hypothetical protein